MTDRAHVLWIATAVRLVVALLVVLSLVRRRRLRGKYGLFWLLVVLGFLPFAIDPDLVDAVGNRLGIRYQPALLMIAGIAVLTLLAMHFSWEVSRLEERSRAMAEELALLRAKVEEAATHPDLPPTSATVDASPSAPAENEGGEGGGVEGGRHLP